MNAEEFKNVMLWLAESDKRIEQLEIANQSMDIHKQELCHHCGGTGKYLGQKK